MVLQKRYKILINYIIGPILFCWLIWSIYRQIMEQKNVAETWYQIVISFKTGQWKSLLIVFLLMFLNWSIETKKWQLLIKTVEAIGFAKAFRAVFCGQAFALNTPNNLGEYVGRVLYLGDGNRLRSVALTMVGSVAQLIITFVLGIISLLLMRTALTLGEHAIKGFTNAWFYAFLCSVVIFTVLLIMLYTRLSWVNHWFQKIKWLTKYSFLTQNLEEISTTDLIKIIGFSFIRYIVFGLQYLILLHMFSVSASLLELTCMVSILFLALAIVPTIALAELGVRGYLSILLLNMLSDNITGIIIASTCIWLINRIIPAIAGSLFVLGVKLFKSKS